MLRELIDHDDRINNIFLFLRPQARSPYWYLGTLGYLMHDSEREAPVHFQWQLLDWPASPEIFTALSDQILTSKVIGPAEVAVEDEQLTCLTVVPISAVSIDYIGVNTSTFRARKIADRAAQGTRNRALGKAGEEAVVKYEKDRLTAAGRSDLADLVKHRLL